VRRGSSRAHPKASPSHCGTPSSSSFVSQTPHSPPHVQPLSPAFVKVTRLKVAVGKDNRVSEPRRGSQRGPASCQPFEGPDFTFTKLTSPPTPSDAFIITRLTLHVRKANRPGTLDCDFFCSSASPRLLNPPDIRFVRGRYHQQSKEPNNKPRKSGALPLLTSLHHYPPVGRS